MFNDILYEDFLIKNFVNLSDDEARIVLEWRNHPVIREWMYSSDLISLEDHYKFIERLKIDHSNFYWLVRRKNDKALLGVIYINKIDWISKTGEFGVYKNPDLFDIKGIGKLLSLLEIDIAFRKLGLKQLALKVHKKNDKAIYLYEKIGFTHTEESGNFLIMELKYHEIA